MSAQSTLYRNHRFPPQIISHAVWRYYGYRDVEDLLAECGVEVGYEAIRRWRAQFGLGDADVVNPRSHSAEARSR